MTIESPIAIDWTAADAEPASRVTAISARLGMPTRGGDGVLTPDGIELLLGDLRPRPGDAGDTLPVVDIHRVFFSRGRLQELIEILVATAKQYDNYDAIVQSQEHEEEAMQ